MKILFLENRYKTYFFDAIATHLEKNGHEIHWIIQNDFFQPKNKSNLHIIEYPKKYSVDKQKPIDASMQKIIDADRQLNFFEHGNIDHFFYYDEEINRILKKINPDLVFGESTVFHELLTVKNCKALGILYLNPSSSRYPAGRFSFYEFDSLTPFEGSGEILPEERAKEIIDQIVYRKTKPDYMHKFKSNRLKNFKDTFLKLSSYYKGDKYNTPHPLKKYRLEKKKNENILAWDATSVGHLENHTGMKILYPLQMQPEANLDVWGHKYRNQTNLVRRIIENTPSSAILYIKPNPKSKYELSDDLIDYVKSCDRIITIQHNVDMIEVFDKIDLVITVTGTIAIESILSNKPVITLQNTLNNSSPNCLFLDDFSELPFVIQKIQSNEFPKASIDERIQFLNKLNASSYQGIISDPFTAESCLQDDNIEQCISAFEDIIKKSVYA
ncbi:hypothetical protein QQ020_26575 [Fulvivirgaceae bacterium BMA12]|uniref:Capsule polysaccharide biosynthesis protein n=1 Tax=Agaribacillus aureus TaxID=3051825 RepID=A0ABT8LEM2_9BACT|nr:hypothetical protein [Fulvivirgaceae bacterium BMA12]